MQQKSENEIFSMREIIIEKNRRIVELEREIDKVISCQSRSEQVISCLDRNEAGDIDSVSEVSMLHSILASR
jgi:hypothetical protein